MALFAASVALLWAATEGGVPMLKAAPGLCAVVDCSRTTRGAHCVMHSQRLRRTGNLGPSGYIQTPGRSLMERIYPRLKAAGSSPEWDCWEWTGALRRGYGTVRVGAKLFYTHRLVYQDMVGEIPEFLLLDHTCLNRACANPWHLDPVTDAINKARGGHWHGERHAA